MGQARQEEWNMDYQKAEATITFFYGGKSSGQKPSCTKCKKGSTFVTTSLDDPFTANGDTPDF